MTFGKLRLFLLLFPAISVYAQNPATLQVTNVFDISSATQVIDNRSITRSCNVSTFTVLSGTGSWSVQLEYADGSNTGPWTAFGSTAVVTYQNSNFVGIGSGYHDFFRMNTTAGTTVVNFSCEKNLYLPTGNGSGGSGSTACSFSPASEVPGGVPNGTLATFTLSEIPSPSTLQLTNNGVSLAAGVDYTLSSSTITFLSGDIPTTGDQLYARYFYLGMSGSCVGAGASYLDIRAYGAIGVTGATQGSCKGSTIDDQPAIQATLTAAVNLGIPRVYVPGGYCWPIANHVWVPPGVELFGAGRTFGYEQSSQGSLIIANANWTVNAPFPYSQMIWISGDNYTYPATVTAINVTFGTVVDHMEINCADTPGCGNIYAIGRQEKSHIDALLLTGTTTPTNGANGGYVYPFFEQGVDCNGSSPNAHGCLIPMAGVGSINPGSGQQGPDTNLEIFPSFTTAPATGYWIPFAEMGAANYQGLRFSTINGYYGSTPYSVYFWGSNSVMGPVHTENVTTGSLYLGPIPNFSSTCIGADHSIFTGFDATATISNCSAQQQLTFQTQGAGGFTTGNSPYTVINLKNSTNISDDNYCFDVSITNGTIVQGPCGTRAGVATYGTIAATDPGTVTQNGYAGMHEYVGTFGSGFNAGIANQNLNNTTRGYICGNCLLSTSDYTSWLLGGDGGSDYSSVGLANNGNLEISTSSSVTSPFTNATWATNVSLVATGGHHVMIGTGLVNTTTNLPINEGSSQLQVRGSTSTTGAWIEGNSREVSSPATSSTCPTAATVGASCTFTMNISPTLTSTPPYNAQCTPYQPTGFPVVTGISGETTSQFIVTIKSVDGSASGATSMSCWVTP